MVCLLCCWEVSPLLSQQLGERGSTYTLNVPVDEVSLTLRVPPDAPPLRAADVRIFDNGKRQTKIVTFERLEALPVHVDVLFDASPSMGWLQRNRSIAAVYVKALLRKGVDKGAVVQFDFDSRVVQGWTDDVDALLAALASVGSNSGSRLGGTALYDAVYRACRDQFAGSEGARSGNALLLFTDGLDNASHARLEDAVTECQQTRTAVYVCSSDAKSRFSAGQKVLQQLTAQTGGQMFFPEAGKATDDDVRAIFSEQKTQYRIGYKPARLKHDGSYHKLRLETPLAQADVHAPAGYFAEQ